MKILFDGYPLEHAGVGLGSFAQRLLNGLLAHGNELKEIVIAMPSRSAGSPALTDPRVRIAHISTPRRGGLLRGLWFSEMLAAYGRRRAGDYILLHPAGSCARTPPERTLTVFHDCIYRHFPKYRGRMVARAWLQDRGESYARRSACVVTESMYSAVEIKTLIKVSAERVHVIPAWLPPEFNRVGAGADAPRVRGTYKLPARFWLYVGGYDYRKNVEFLLEAYAIARRHASCPPLVLAGKIPTDLSKPYCDVFGAMRKHGLTRSEVLMPGFIAQDDLPGLYAAAELFIYPSLYEGFGLPPLEAMGCGCPTLVADNSSLPEVVKDVEYRFPTSNVEVLALRLAGAAKEPLPLNPAFRPEDFDEKASINQYLHLIRQVSIS